MDLGSDITELGGAVGSLFTSQGNAAQANDFQGASTLATQNAQLAAASTKIQATQTARSVAQSLGTSQADVAGAGFTTSGSALAILRSSASQGALAKSLVNIQGAINENSYAAQAGAYAGEAKAANEASTAGTIGAIGAIGGALVSGTGKLASAGNTVSQGVNYISGLFGPATDGFGDEVVTGNAGQLLSGLGPDGLAADTGAAVSGTDTVVTAGAAVDTSGISIGSTLSDVTSGISDFVSGAADTVVEGVGDAFAGAAEVAGDVADAAAGVGDFLGTVGDVIGAALTVICTAYYKQGMVSRSALLGALKYGMALDRRTHAGYTYWASPVARKITKDRWFAKLLAPVFLPMINETAVIMGQAGVKRTAYGYVSFRVFLGFSWAVGLCIGGEDHVNARA